MPKRRSNHRQFSHELIEPGINNEGLLTESDSDVEFTRGRNRGLDDHSSDEGLVTPKKKQKKESGPMCYGLRRWCGWIVSRERRRITLHGQTTPGRFMTNKLNNNKYNLITFVPVVLFH